MAGKRKTERLKYRNLPFARVILELRNSLGMLQTEFAQEVGCSVAALSDWENGLTQPHRMAEKALKQVAQEHGYTMDIQKGALIARTNRQQWLTGEKIESM